MSLKPALFHIGHDFENTLGVTFPLGSFCKQSLLFPGSVLEFQNKLMCKGPRECYAKVLYTLKDVCIVEQFALEWLNFELNTRSILSINEHVFNVTLDLPSFMFLYMTLSCLYFSFWVR